MKHFASSGTWFPAEDSSNTVQGTLHFDSEGLNLRLIGNFDDGWSPGLNRYPTIHGVVDGNPYGTFVTLVDSFTKQSRFNMPGVSSETIACSRAVIGSTHLPGGMIQAEALEVVISHLKDWVGQTGITFKVLGDNEYAASYAKPEIPSFPFGDKKLSLVTSVRPTHGMHRVVLEEETFIVVEPIGDCSLSELGGDPIRTLQNLLSFVTDTPNEVEEIMYSGLKNDQELYPEYHLVFDPPFRLKGKKSLHAPDMLFTFRDAQKYELNIFEKWLDFTKMNRSFCTVYFADLYAEPTYLNDRFISLMKAFTLLVARTGMVSERTKLFAGHVETALRSCFSDGEAEFLDQIIPTAAELEMPFHLLRLLDENQNIIQSFIPDIPGFVRSVYDTIGFFERRIEGARPHLQGENLLHAMMKIRLLVQIVVLKELGFGEDALRSLVMRNNKLGFLRTV